MDTAWSNVPIHSHAYKDGVEFFIDFSSQREVQGTIKCPCIRCCHEKKWTCDAIDSHILSYGFWHGCTIWIFQDENRTKSNAGSGSLFEWTCGSLLFWHRYTIWMVLCLHHLCLVYNA